jgi:hypothetical protein
MHIRCSYMSCRDQYTAEPNMAIPQMLGHTLWCSSALLYKNQTRTGIISCVFVSRTRRNGAVARSICSCGFRTSLGHGRIIEIRLQMTLYAGWNPEYARRSTPPPWLSAWSASGKMQCISHIVPFRRHRWRASRQYNSWGYYRLLQEKYMLWTN